MNTIKKEVLDNGLTILTDRCPMSDRFPWGYG